MSNLARIIKRTGNSRTGTITVDSLSPDTQSGDIATEIMPDVISIEPLPVDFQAAVESLEEQIKELTFPDGLSEH